MQFTYRTVSQSKRRIKTIEELMVERDVLKFEIATKQINWKFIFFNAFDELTKSVEYYLFNDPFYHLY